MELAIFGKLFVRITAEHINICNIRSHEQNHQCYLNQGAVAVTRRLRVKVIMMIDVNKATDDRLQGSAVLQHLPHAGDNALGDGAVGQIGRRAHQGDNAVAYRLQGCEQSLVIHVGGCEDKGDESGDKGLYNIQPPLRSCPSIDG